MTTEEKLGYRLKLFDDVLHQRKVDRVPHIFNSGFWPVHDYGVTLTQAGNDLELMMKIGRAFLEKYKFDTMLPFGVLFCNPRQMLDGVGKGYNIWNDEIGMVSLEDLDLMQPEDYDLFNADLMRWMWEVALPKKFPNWKNLTIGDFMKGAGLYGAFYGDYLVKMMTAMPMEYGVPNIFSLLGMFGIENLCLFFRGMKGISVDMRRQPEKFEKACQVADETGALAEQMLTAGAPKGSAFGFYALMLAHNFLNAKQFERFYWPQLKKMLDAAQKAGSSVYMFAEGEILRFADYLKDYPKGVIAIHLEKDDIFEVRKALPNVTVVGGMTTEMLGYETPEKCVSYAKFLCDELGRNGGFCLSQNKMMSYKNDARPENLKAVCDFIADYHF